MSKQQQPYASLADYLVKQSVETGNRKRQEKIEAWGRINQEKKNIYTRLTEKYFDGVCDALARFATEEARMSVDLMFHTGSFTFNLKEWKSDNEIVQASLKIGDKNPFGYPNQIARRWFAEMQNPESELLEGYDFCWSGIKIKMLDHFDGYEMDSKRDGFQSKMEDLRDGRIYDFIGTESSYASILSYEKVMVIRFSWDHLKERVP